MMIKVLVVDDSEVASRFLQHVIESDPRLKVIGFASDGEEAVAMVEKTNPDVITMDISMPKLNGFDATRRIMEVKPTPIVIVSGLYTENDLSAGFKAIDSGALAILSRPSGIQDPHYAEMAGNLIETIKVISGIKVITRKQGKAATSPIQLNVTGIRAIGIGASLGGPPALEKVLSALPAKFPIPIFIVQHISNGFTKGLADWLQKTVQLKIVIPKDQEIATPSTIYIAPDRLHMTVDRNNKITLTKGFGKEICPSINRLMQSLAIAHEKDSVGIILTGMGQDGAEGLLEMKKKGAITVAQDADECVMYSMPKAAMEMGSAKLQLHLDEISALIRGVAHE